MQGIRIMSVAAAVVLAAYVVAEPFDADLGSGVPAVRIAVVVAAVIVAALSFHAWSAGSTPHTISAMVVGLLGGASLASTVTTATHDDVYGSAPMALVGTLAIVAAVTISQVGQTRTKTPHP